MKVIGNKTYLFFLVMIFLGCSVEQNKGSGKSIQKSRGQAEQNEDGSSEEEEKLGNQDGSEVDPTELETEIVDFPIKITAEKNLSTVRTCVRLGVVGKEMTDIGCTEAPNEFYQDIDIPLKTRPACNKLRIELPIALYKGASTSDPNLIVWGESESLANKVFRLYSPNTDQLIIEINDNAGSTNDVDATVTLTGLSLIDFTVENSDKACN